MIIFNNRGVSIVLLIMIMLITAILGGAIASFMGAKQKSFPLMVNSYRAHEIANAGVEYAIQYGRDNDFSSNPLVVNLSNISFGGGSFTTAYDQPNNRLTSTGAFGGVTRVVALGNFSNYVGGAGYDITFDTDIADFNSPIQNQAGFFNTNLADKYLTIGNNTFQNRFGGLWYTGNKTGFCGSAVGGPAGACTFGTGFRAYFVLRMIAPPSGNTGEGFVFAVANADRNMSNYFAIGGESAMGELLAYGGDSRNSGAVPGIAFLDRREGKGIRSPKFGVEFDNKEDGCAANAGASGSRCDGSRDHMAYVFWGPEPETAVPSKEITSYLSWQSAFAPSEYTADRAITAGTYRYRSLTTGVSGTTQPSWPTEKGDIVSDGTVMWQEATYRTGLFDIYFEGDIVVPDAWNGTYRQCISDVCWPFLGFGVWQSGALQAPGYSPSYDDNRHGSGLNPPSSSSSTDGYFTALGEGYPTNWLIRNPPIPQSDIRYAFRIEVTRSLVTPYNYIIRSWLKLCPQGDGVDCPTHTNSSFGNVNVDYYPTWTSATPYAVGATVVPVTWNGYYYTATVTGTSGAVQPAWPTTVGATVVDGTVIWRCAGTLASDARAKLNRTLALNASQHTSFSRFIFGWTSATSTSATQTITIRKFRLSFRR